MWVLEYKILALNFSTTTATGPAVRDSGQHSPCHSGTTNTPRIRHHPLSSAHPAAQ